MPLNDSPNSSGAQRALEGAKLLQTLSQEAAQRQKAGAAVSSDAKGKASEKAAQAVGSSAKQVERAKIVLDYGIRNLEQLIRDGEATLSDAAAIARMPPQIQRLAVEAVKSSKARTLAQAVHAAEKAGLCQGGRPKMTEPAKPPPSHQELVAVLRKAFQLAGDCNNAWPSPTYRTAYEQLGLLLHDVTRLGPG